MWSLEQWCLTQCLAFYALNKFLLNNLDIADLPSETINGDKLYVYFECIISSSDLL